MSNQTKAEKLKILDEKVLDTMITMMDNKQFDALSDLTTAVQYLKANQVVEPATRGESDPVEERKKKLQEVKNRRE